MKQAAVIHTQMKSAVVEQASLKNAVVVAATPGGLDLSVIGIPDSIQRARPQELYFPGCFNQAPEARTVWLQMFNDRIFQDDIKEILDNREAWLFAVRSFMDQCNKESIDPFKSRKDPTINNAVRTIMARRRHDLRVYIDRSKLFTKVTVEATTAKRAYEWLSNGNVRLKVSVQFEVDGGREALIPYLKSTHMKMLADGRGGFTRNLMKNLTVGVERITSKKAVLYYTMEIAQPYHVPDSKQNKRDKVEWFDKEFFNPMIRGQRFDTLRRRVKF